MLGELVEAAGVVEGPSPSARCLPPRVAWAWGATPVCLCRKGTCELGGMLELGEATAGWLYTNGEIQDVGHDEDDEQKALSSVAG